MYIITIQTIKHVHDELYLSLSLLSFNLSPVRYVVHLKSFVAKRAVSICVNLMYLRLKLLKYKENKILIPLILNLNSSSIISIIYQNWPHVLLCDPSLIIDIIYHIAQTENKHLE